MKRKAQLSSYSLLTEIVCATSVNEDCEKCFLNLTSKSKGLWNCVAHKGVKTDLGIVRVWGWFIFFGTGCG